MTDPFEPDIVTAVLQHMNEDHADDSLLIIRTLGQLPNAISVQLTDLEPEGATFKAKLPTGDCLDIVLPWTSEIRERPQFRGEFAYMYRQAVNLARGV